MSEEVFNNEVYSGPTQNDFTVKVDKSVSDEAFKATWGMTRDELQRKNEADVKALFNEGSESKKDEIGRVFEKDENKLKEKALTSGNAKSMVDTGGVFEKQDKLDEQPRFSETPNKGLDNVNIDGDAFYDESDTMDPKQPHLSRQTTRPEDVKIYYHDTKDTVTEVKGLDPKVLDNLRDQIDKDNNKKDMDPTLSGPKFLIPDMVK